MEAVVLRLIIYSSSIRAIAIPSDNKFIALSMTTLIQADVFQKPQMVQVLYKFCIMHMGHSIINAHPVQ